MELGPQHGNLTLHTGRSGAAAKVGHDLTLGIQRWSIEVDPAARLTMSADLDSLTVIKGDGGLKPLSDKDKVTILGHAKDTLKATSHPAVLVTIDGPTDASGTADAAVTIAGQTRSVPVSIEISDSDPARITVTAALLQTAFGIKPYSGLLGALKVADEVTIRLDVSVPRP
jgi:hypothetical protein